MLDIEKFPPKTQTVILFNDAAALTESLNRRHQRRYWADKSETKFPYLVTAGSGVVFSVAINSFMTNSPIKALIEAGFASLLLSMARVPNLLFGNGRFHGFTRGQKVADDVYKFLKLCREYLTIKDKMNEMKEKGDKFTPVQLAHMKQNISKIRKDIEQMVKREERRWKLESLIHLHEEMDQTVDNLKKLNRKGRKHRELRRKQIEKIKPKAEAARTKGADELAKRMGPLWEEFAYLLQYDETAEKDPKDQKTQRDEETEKRDTDGFQKHPSGLWIPAETNKPEKSGAMFNREEVKWVKQEFPENIDYRRLAKMYEGLIPSLEQLTQHSNEFSKPKRRLPSFPVKRFPSDPIIRKPKEPTERIS